MKVNEVREYLKTIPFDESKFGKYKIHQRHEREFHVRFEMSGYNVDEIPTVVINTNILLLFAKFGIFDYTDFLCIDFHKGTGTLYYKESYDSELIEIDYTSFSTCAIIADIFERTVYSGKFPKRR